MKFKIRFADQIVGFFVVLALVMLIIVVFLLGNTHRWFANDILYKTYFNSASGLSVNMPLQYKGFTIGNVKSIALNERDDVEVIFSIYENYADRVRLGSIVELTVSPIGLGSQFIFYPGLGSGLLEEGELIPRFDSREGRELVTLGLVLIPGKEDSISSIIAQVDTVLADIDIVLRQVQGALSAEADSPIGQALNGVNQAIADINNVTANLNRTITPILNNVDAITGDVKTITTELSSADGLLMTLLGPDGTLAVSIDTALISITGTMQNLEKVSAFIPQQLPQIAALIVELRQTLQTAEDVLVAVRNSPLLKNGVPSHIETQSNGTNPRDIAF
jgi:phospholipid/cholesterol/gamma-HCH transport system substrate-binding protein